MKFGVREICNVVFRATAPQTIGASTFEKGQPVLYIDSAKASTLEGAATSVYATGGRGNTRLVTWEGEKTLSFSVEDALISQMGLAILSGAGLIKGNSTQKVHVHTTMTATLDSDKKIDVSKFFNDTTSTICDQAPIFIVKTEADGSLTGVSSKGTLDSSSKKISLNTNTNFAANDKVFVDFYVWKKADAVSEIIIDASHFAGTYYVEAETLFRRQTDGFDAPVAITLPNVKIQSNFTFSMASSGDPSTFNFQMDAHPGYTYFNPDKEVLCVMQVIEEKVAVDNPWESVMMETGKHADIAAEG